MHGRANPEPASLPRRRGNPLPALPINPDIDRLRPTVTWVKGASLLAARDMPAMKDHIFGDREKAMEESYFRREDAKLLEKLREKAPLDQIALALRRKLHVDNPGLLIRARETGVAPDAAPALFLAPLVQVAWADGSISRAERKAVLRLARGRGVDPESPAYGQLIAWMDESPPDSIFETALEVIKYGFSVLTPSEREDRINSIVDACREVAAASGTILGWALALVDPDAAAAKEAAILQMIASRLRARVGSN